MGYLLSAIVPTQFPDRDLNNIKEMIIPDSQLIQYVIVIDEFKFNNLSEREILKISELSQYDNVRILSGKFGNPGSARNQGLKLASGEYVSFWDSDDKPQVNLVLNAIEQAKKNTENWDILIGQFAIEYIGQEKISTPTSTLSLEKFIWETGLWRVVVRKPFMENIAFPEIQMAEDQIFILQLVFHDPNVVFSRDHFYTYVKHQQYQLTTDKSAIQDLVGAFTISRRMIDSARNKRHKEYARVLSLRQLNGALRRGNLETRKSIVKIYCRSFEFRDLNLLSKELLRNYRKT
jgi:glycosyltransferase involved in cell wall biosynthesis